MKDEGKIRYNSQSAIFFECQAYNALNKLFSVVCFYEFIKLLKMKNKQSNRFTTHMNIQTPIFLQPYAGRLETTDNKLST